LSDYFFKLSFINKLKRASAQIEIIEYAKNLNTILISIVPLLFIPLLISCQNSYQKTENQNANFILEIKKSLNFDLENDKTAYTKGVQVYPSQNPQYLLFFHSHGKYTSIYDLKSQELLNEI